VAPAVAAVAPVVAARAACGVVDLFAQPVPISSAIDSTPHTQRIVLSSWCASAAEFRADPHTPQSFMHFAHPIDRTNSSGTNPY